MTTPSIEPAAREASVIRRDCAYIALASLLPLVILRPLQDVPFVDDWVYAWAVENLKETGSLQILDLSASINLVQVLWGWLFCLPFGFSFIALRLSTWVLSVVCLCGLYLTLREFSVERREALIGTAVLGLYPPYFILSFTFMTDVPFLAAVVWSTLCFVRAVNRSSDRHLFIGSALACLAVSTRLLGAVLPAMFVATLAFSTGRWGRNPKRLAIACAPAVCLVLLMWLSPVVVAHRADMSTVSGSTMMRSENLIPGLVFLPALYVMNLSLVAGTLGMALAPLAIGIAGTVPSKKAIRIAMLILLLLAGQLALGLNVYHALHNDFFWNPHELGLAERLTPNMQGHGPTPHWVWGVHVLAVGFFSIVITAAGRTQGVVGSKALGWLAGGSFLLMTAVWAVYDRYALLLVPPLIVLTLINRKLARPSLTVALLALFGLLSFATTRDHLAYNAALWTTVGYLDKAGVAKKDIHGGWVIDGWFQYAHSENAALDAKGSVLVRGVTTDEPVRYKISNQPTPGARVLFEAPYERWLGRSGSVYVLDLEGG